MDNKKYQFEIEPVIIGSSPYMDGYRYNVQVKSSVDGEKYYYCGIGKFCKTRDEITEYITRFKMENSNTEEEILK